jgi:hypothetical protein
MEIHLNITFPRIPCELLTLDVMDVSGEQQTGVQHGVNKVRLSDYREGPQHLIWDQITAEVVMGCPVRVARRRRVVVIHAMKCARHTRRIHGRLGGVRALSSVNAKDTVNASTRNGKRDAESKEL